MASAETEGKRPRFDSWSGPSHSNHPPQATAHQRVRHAADVSARFSTHPLPTSAQTTYHEAEQRELPDPLSHPYHGHDPSSHPYNNQNHAGYVTSANSVTSHYPPDQQAYPRPVSTPMKSRSPVDAHSQHNMRTLSISTGNISQHPLQYPADHPASAGFHDHQPNGNHQALPMPNHDTMPSTHPPSYATSPVSGGPRDYYVGGSSISAPLVTTYPPRRKAIRAAQACDQCRQRKAKCDEGRPSCGFCKEAAMPCVYREVPPPKQDRTLLQILQKLDGLEAQLHDLREGRWPLPPPHHVEDPNARSESDQAEDGPLVRSPGINQDSRTHAVHAAALESQSPPGDSALDAQVGPKPEVVGGGVAGEVGDLSIPMEHTTAAHKLLRWPSIRGLMAQITEDEHYVMQGEENRGILRVHGRGEGNDLGDRGVIGFPSDVGNPEVEAISHDSPGSIDGLWGNGVPSPPETRRPTGEFIGGLNPEGSLKLDAPTLMRLLDSYLQNIHIMHPFLNKDRITQMVHDFGVKYGPPSDYQAASPFTMASPYSAINVRRDSPTLNKAAKRKRSLTNIAGTPPSMSNTSGPRPAPERSIGSVLVLLVVALGKICEHKEFLPGPVPETYKPTTGVSPPVWNSDPYSVRHSPGSSQSSSFTSVPSPHDASAGPPRKSVDAATPNAAPMNVDVIPGLAYYATATDILGNLVGGNELPHVQAGLLAGLYAGQLARVLESWKWIHFACTACQLLIRPLKFQKEKNPVRRDLTLTAFWTCLQLESDILAELDLPPSGITRHEDTMPFPEIKSDDLMIGFYYLAQIGLRKLLNRVHNSLYKPEQKDAKHAGWSTSELKELDHQLSSWRNLLPEPLKWNDGEPPPSQINAARLRAKYYGARYVIHRPFLHHTLHPMTPQRGNAQGSPSVSGLAQSRSPTTPAMESRTSLPMAPPANPYPASTRQQIDTLEGEVKDACRNCISAAMSSTKAFHGIPENHRPIVTNIFGTAHAQFGNLLVLSVASKSELLRDLVPQQEFDRLLERTIRFLEQLSPISPTLRADKQILARSLKPSGSSISSN